MITQLSCGAVGDPEVKVLGRMLTWTETGITYEADPKHAQHIMAEMNLHDHSKPLSTPCAPNDSEQVKVREESRSLNKDEAARYRGVAARLNYLALDRADLQFAAKCVCKYMSNPREHDWAPLKRVARYLLGAPRAVQYFQWQQSPRAVFVSVDSDWAGDRHDRKSTSGGAMYLGNHLVKSWATTQKHVALSSGEAEIYALVKGAAQAKLIVILVFESCL